MSTSILNKNQSVLVCGAGGFIGGHMIAGLRNRGFKHLRAVDIKPTSQWFQPQQDVENVILNLRNNESCEKAINGMDHVINLAADMGGMGYIAAHRAECMLNVLINTHMLMAARQRSIKSFFFASSACVYNQSFQSSADVAGLREEDAWPALPEEGYGMEKLFGEEMCRMFRQDFGIPASFARYHNVYGPFGVYEGGREKAPAALCRKVAQAKLGGNTELEIWGDGNQRRSFLYADDAIEGTLRLIGSGEPGPVNIGSEESVTINELLDVIESIGGIKCKRKYVSDAPQGVRGRCSDNTKLREILGWSPSITLRQGLESTYRWIYDRLKSTHAVGIR